MSASRAATLVRLLHTGRPSPRACTTANAVIVLYYHRTGGRDLLVSGCEPATLSTGSERADLSASAVTAVGELAGLTIPDTPNVATPDDLGRTITSVLPSLGHPKGGITAQVDLAEMMDPSAPFGQVRWQDPLPGAPQTAGVLQTDVFIAVGHAPRCGGRDLTGAYSGYTSGTQENFGLILLGDTGLTRCTLTGRVSITGVNARGIPVTNSVSGPLPHLVLAPGSPARVRDAGPFTLSIAFSGGADSGAAETAENPCAPSKEVSPAAWVMHFSAGATVRFPDTLTADASDPNDGPYWSCGGRIELGAPGETPGQAIRLNPLVN